MIDIHAHILPNLDDGADSMESALAMAELALNSGVTALAATAHSGLPHQDMDRWLPHLEKKLASFRKALREAGLPLEVYLGMEILGSADTAELLRRGLLTTLNASRYPLIEFPFQRYAQNATQVLSSVLELGLRPVVAHPERYHYVQQTPSLLSLWADMGCLFQVNRGSLLGRFGQREQELALAMVDRGFVCAVASDGHSPHYRTTWMGDVGQLLAEEFSPETAWLLTDEHPRLLLEDQTIYMKEPYWF